MPKGDKYVKLKEYLLCNSVDTIILTFNDIEKIISAALPKSAYEFSEQWWSNNYDHSQAIAWMDAGYETDYVTNTYKDKKIVFVKRR